MELTSEQFKRLVELAYIGEWVVNSRHGLDFQDDEATGALQGLLGLASSLVDEIDRDVETNNFYIDPDWADKIQDRYISDYDDHVFWDELIERLAQRDLAKQRGVSMEEINRDEDVAILRPAEERYREELELNGLDRLMISDEY
jgi:hypothetical protein